MKTENGDRGSWIVGRGDGVEAGLAAVGDVEGVGYGASSAMAVGLPLPPTAVGLDAREGAGTKRLVEAGGLAATPS